MWRAADPGEQRDLASDQQQRRDALVKSCRAWREQVKAPVPTQLNPEYVGK